MAYCLAKKIMEVICKFKEKGTFNYGFYEALNGVISPFTGKVTDFKAVGRLLPAVLDTDYLLHGVWTGKSSDGVPEFKVSSYEEIRPLGRQDAINYLSKIPGIYRRTAAFMVETYGVTELFHMLDTDIDYIGHQFRIKPNNLKRMKREWAKRNRASSLFSFLSNYDISDVLAMRVYERFYDTSIGKIISDPYILMEIEGFTFDKTDEIALSLKFDALCEERLKAGVLQALLETEQGGAHLGKYNRKAKNPICSGSTYLYWNDLVKFTNFILKENLSPVQLGEIVLSMNGNSLEIIDDKYFARKTTFDEEKTAAANVKRLLENYKKDFSISKEEMASIQDELVNVGGLPGHLSDEQQNAVITVLEEGVSIVTGGPGCGKTQIIKAMLYLMDKHMPGKRVLCMAPTGRAASRMIEATGRPSQTIHSALGLYGSGRDEKETMLNADIVIIDEFSMVDSQLAAKLFNACKNGAKVVCVGDDKQLPSVGCGSVLKELLDCGVVPTAVLTQVFRQKKGSSIADNASRIKNGKTDMIVDDSFRYIQAPNEKGALAKTVIDTFRSEVGEFGLDNVCVLTPFRRSTDTGVNELNKELQKTIFPDKDPRYRYVVGDKIMFMKNAKGIANGDVGVVTRISEGEYELQFAERNIILDGEEMKDSVVLAYSTTVHKSQGSEYQSVILVMDKRHALMHQRAITYTAITRAKKRITVVFQEDGVFEKSIQNENSSLRNSLIGKLLREE